MTAQPRISASRVAMLLGESKYGTPLSLYHELRGDPMPREESELLEEGIEFEPIILRAAAKKYGLRLVEGPKELAHGDLLGHPDGYVIDEQGKLAIIESKNTLFTDVDEEVGWGQPGTDRVPMSYFYQCQVYGWLLMKGAAAVSHTCQPGDVCRAFPVKLETALGIAVEYEISDTVLLAARLRRGTSLYRIKVDPEVIASIEAAASAFLDRVARGEPPDPTSVEEFRRRWAPVPEKRAEATVAQLEIAKARAGLKAQIKIAEAEVEKLDMVLLAYMGDASELWMNGKKLLSAGADRKFDEQALAVERPDLYAKYLRKFDRDAFKRDHKGLDERFLKPPPPEKQVRKIRANDLEGP